MGLNPGELNTQLQDRAFFMRNVRVRRRPGVTILILAVLTVVSAMFAGQPLGYQAPMLLRVLGVVMCFFGTGVVISFLSFLARLPVQLIGIPLIMLGLLLGMMAFALSVLFGSTRVDNDGVHIRRVFWRRTLPWQRIRGFAVRLGTRSGRSMGGFGLDVSHRQQIVAVDDAGRTLSLPGAMWAGSGRSPEVTEALCRLDGFRRWRQ